MYLVCRKSSSRVEIFQLTLGIFRIIKPCDLYSWPDAADISLKPNYNEEHLGLRFQKDKYMKVSSAESKLTERHYCSLGVISLFSLFAQASLCWTNPWTCLALLPGCRFQMLWVWFFVLLSQSLFICWFVWCPRTLPLVCLWLCPFQEGQVKVAHDTFDGKLLDILPDTYLSYMFTISIILSSWLSVLLFSFIGPPHRWRADRHLLQVIH